MSGTVRKDERLSDSERVCAEKKIKQKDGSNIEDCDNRGASVQLCSTRGAAAELDEEEEEELLFGLQGDARCWSALCFKQCLLQSLPGQRNTVQWTALSFQRPR